jgi:hypothetical protein
VLTDSGGSHSPVATPYFPALPAGGYSVQLTVTRDGTVPVTASTGFTLS